MNNTSAISKRYLFLVLTAIGTVAYMITDIMHEAVGHGSMCLIQGGKIKLITSVYFRAQVHSFLTDFGGPLMNLLTGLFLCTVLAKTTIRSRYFQLLLLITAAFNLFWFSWLCFYSSITYKGDFSFVFNTENGLLLRRILLILFSLASYWLSLKLLGRIYSRLRYKFEGFRYLFFISYVSACMAALVAVSCYSPMSVNTYMGAIHFPMFAPLLLIPIFSKTGKINYTNGQISELKESKWSKIFILLVALLFIIFCLVMGRGMRF